MTNEIKPEANGASNSTSDRLAATKPIPPEHRRQSVIARSYDAAMEQAQSSQAEKMALVRDGVLNETDGRSAHDAVQHQRRGAELEDDRMIVGEEIREREFPVPDRAAGAAFERLIVDEATVYSGGMRHGNEIGALPGDRASNGEVPTIVDPDGLAPNLHQEQN